MYRLLKMSGKIYSLNIGDCVENDAKNIDQFVGEGDIVILCDDLECAADFFEIEVHEIVSVDEED